MERWQIITAIVAIYLATTLAIGLAAARRATRGVTGYVAADRRFGVLPMYFIVGGTIFSAFAFLGGPGWAYSRGMAVLYILAYGVLGIAPWYFICPKSARIGRRFNLVTQAQLVTARFPSRTLSALMALIAVAAFVPYVMLQMTGAGIVFNAVTQGNVPFWLGAAVAYGVVITYVLIGGASAVGWTNVFEGIVMMVVAWGLGLYLPHALYGGIGPMFEQIEAARPELLSLPGLAGDGTTWGWGAYSTAILSSAIGFAMWPHLFMKAFTAKDDDTMRRTVMLFPTFQLFLIPVFLIGFAGVLFEGAPPSADFILPFMILETNLPSIVVGLFCAGALSASMSTGDALLHASASVVVEDGVTKFVELDEARQRRLMQALVLLTGAIAYAFAQDPDSSLVLLLASAYGIISQFAPPVVAALYWKRATTAGVVGGLVAGTATAFFFWLNPGLRPLDMHEGILGLMAHVPVLVLVSLATPAQDDEHVGAFFS
jgi:solute:Na+ symporter, SSS family